MLLSNMEQMMNFFVYMKFHILICFNSTLGVITNGGAKPNIIPEETAMQFYIRAPTMGELELLKGKMVKCFEAAATATGCEVIYLNSLHCVS